MTDGAQVVSEAIEETENPAMEGPRTEGTGTEPASETEEISSPEPTKAPPQGGSAERAAKASARIHWRWRHIENFYEQSRMAVHNYLVDLAQVDLYTQRDEFLRIEQEMVAGMIEADATIRKMHAGLLDRPLEAPSKVIVPDTRIILPGQ